MVEVAVGILLVLKVEFDMVVTAVMSVDEIVVKEGFEEAVVVFISVDVPDDIIMFILSFMLKDSNC